MRFGPLTHCEFTPPDSRRQSASLKARAFLFLQRCALSQNTRCAWAHTKPLQGIEQILVSGDAAPQRSPVDGCIALSTSIVSSSPVAASPSSLVSASNPSLRGGPHGPLHC